jgi:hypothetical protein
MDNKYYTPELEEFHIGFEYEVRHSIRNIEDTWEKIEFNNCTFESWIETSDGEMPFEAGITEDRLRVKYLDTEDIESLGWKLERETTSPFTNRQIQNFTINKIKGFNTGIVYRLEFNDIYLLEISSESYSSYVTYKANAVYRIKNKSELKILMKQLNIL